LSVPLIRSTLFPDEGYTRSISPQTKIDMPMASFFLVIPPGKIGAKPKHGLYRPFQRYLDSLREKSGVMPLRETSRTSDRALAAV
jgi:hypothetical protein